MLPAFQSRKAAWGFLIVLMGLLTCPLIVEQYPPSKEQTWSGVDNETGPAGSVVQTIYRDKSDADVLFVGNSKVASSIRPELLEQSLSTELGRQVNVKVLALFWPGQDLPFFLLRAYLERHHPRLVVVDLPLSLGIRDEPHLYMYRWLRKGEYSDGLAGLPWQSGLQVYGEFVLGAPRQLLAKIRPNLLSARETSAEGLATNRFNSSEIGYLGGPFVPDSPPAGSFGMAQLLPLESKLFRFPETGPGTYSTHFLKGIVKIAEEKGCKVVFLRLPDEQNYGCKDIPMMTNWAAFFGNGYKTIAVPSADLFRDMTRERVDHFYLENGHYNSNGAQLMTRALVPAVSQALEESGMTRSQSTSSNPKEANRGR